MSFTVEEGRTRILDELAAAVEQLAIAVACFGEAYELVDAQSADVLEERLFGPVQAAYARARRGHGSFADRSGLSRRSFAPGSSGVHDADPRVYLERGLEATESADHLIGELQDSLLPVEVGDRELRDDLAGSRGLIGSVPARARELLRLVGR